MPDWKKIVRKKLGTLPLTNGRRDEVIEELAQQLESAYEEALAQGINEQEALRRSLAQFIDWEKLRSEVFQSVEGTRLPVWEQNGIFAPRRLPVWITLAMTLLLFANPAFRQGLALLPAAIPRSEPIAWGLPTFSEKALRRIEQSGDRQKYARTLAFIALHSPEEDDLRAMHAAEKAIALDPQLTWISAKVSHASYRVPGYDPHPWIERLKAWDPQNGFPYLLEADANVHYWEPPWAKYSVPITGLRSGLQHALAAEPRWRIPMEKAFAARRLDFYSVQQFVLDRQVLQEQGFDRPDMLLAAGWSEPMPNFMTINLYVDIQLKDIGEPTEKAGRTDEALAAYWSVARFGERLGASPMDIARISSNKVRRDAYNHILPLLRSKGRKDEAAAVESALGALPPLNYRPEGYGDDSLRTTLRRSARVIVISGVLVIVLGVSAMLWLTFIVALKWKAKRSRVLNPLASRLWFAPPALLLASVVFFLGYYPFARSLDQIHSSEELDHGYGPFLASVYSVATTRTSVDIWVARMFWPTVWCLVVAVIGWITLRWVASRRDGDSFREE